ncbi:uncharacterized protein FYW49_012831 [Xenentodon cancila]
MGVTSSSSSVGKSSPVDGLHPKAREYYGLKNQGATCYLNSVLQVLFMTRDFREAVRSPIDNKYINHHLHGVFDALLKKPAHTQAITHHLGIKRVHEQHDAAECFEKILSLTSSDASKMFQGELMHTSACSKCGSNTEDEEPFWSLPLTLVDSDTEDYRVVDGIKSFFQESCISGENQLFCEHCKIKTDTKIKFDVVHHPDILTLLLKRFKFDYNHMQYVKLKCRVEVPHILEIPHAGGESQKYQLYAFVEHLGELRNGHYTVTIKSQDDERWYNFNDTVVTLAKQEPFQMDSRRRSQSAYLLFYRKGSAADTSTANTTEVSTFEDASCKNETGKPEEMLVREVRDGKSGVDNDSNVSMNRQDEWLNGAVDDLSDERLENIEKSRDKQRQDSPEPSFNQIQSNEGMVCDSKSTSSTKQKHKQVVSDKEADSRVDENHQNKLNHEVRNKEGDKSVHSRDNKQLDNINQNGLDKYLQQEMNHEGRIKRNISDNNMQNEHVVKTRRTKEAEDVEAGNHHSTEGQGTKKDKSVFTVRLNQDGKPGVEDQRDEEKMMTDQYRVITVYKGSHRSLKKISLCNNQVQSYGGESESKQGTSFNDQNHEQVVNDSSDRRQAHHGGSEEAPDNGPFEEVSLRRSQEDLEQETATQMTKGRVTEVNCEAEPDPKAGEVDTLSVRICNQNQNESSEPHGDGDRNMAVNSNTKYHGLINQGSTCYLNSVLQVLFMTKSFREALQSCNAESLDSHLNELFQDLKKNTAHTYKITEKLGITRGFVQSDAAECLENILSNVTSPGASQLFQGRLTQKNKCCVCERETQTDDPFWNLPLELVGDHSVYSVIDGITKYFSVSEVSGPDQLYCDFCEAKTDSTIKCEIKHHPDVLTLMLKRFKFNYKYLDYEKIKCSVTIPCILEIPPTDTKSQTYELYAFVDHFGDLRNGHYTVTIKSQDDERWYRFNDSLVSLHSYQPFQLDFTETFPRAYLLFYKKVSVPDASAEKTIETSTSEASELGASDKGEKDEHEEEDTQKKKAVKTAVVNHNSVEGQENEEKKRDQKEEPSVEEQLNKVKKTQPPLLTIADLWRSQIQVPVY